MYDHTHTNAHSQQHSFSDSIARGTTISIPSYQISLLYFKQWRLTSETWLRMSHSVGVEIVIANSSHRRQAVDVKM